MKSTKKLMVLALSCAMVLSLAACSGGQSGAGASPSAAPSESAGDKVYTVGISQLAPHVALDAATQGFKDALVAELGQDKVKFIEQNAAGDSNTAGTIATNLVAAKVDLIMANATGSLQTAVAATRTIPILGTSVTEYGVALGITDFNGTVGTNVSGTSDLAPLDQQAAMVKEWFPDAKTVGLLYCSAEPNSQYQVDVVKVALEGQGMTATLFPFSDSNDLAAVTQAACADSDVIYVPTDNTVANNTGVIDNICQGAKVPVIAGEEGIASGCGVATLSISYYDLGTATGKMAAKVLTGEADISKMPIEYAPQFTKKYNADLCTALGLTPPDGYEPIG